MAERCSVKICDDPVTREITHSGSCPVRVCEIDCLLIMNQIFRYRRRGQQFRCGSCRALIPIPMDYEIHNV